MYLLDTDILIDVQRGYQPAVEWLSSLETMPTVPGFVVMELVQGAQNSQQVRQALNMVAPLPVLWPSAADCQHALSNFATFHLSHKLGLLDALIAACAVGASLTLCTYNSKHYRVVPGLKIQQPYQR